MFEAIAWPLGMVLSITAVTIILRPAFLRLVDRTRSISPTKGIDATPSGQLASGDANSGGQAADVDPQAVREAITTIEGATGGLDTPAAQIIGIVLDQYIDTIPLPDRQAVFRRIAAKAMSTTWFERANFNIYGSQIRVLMALNTGGTVDVSKLRPWYTWGAGKWPELYERDGEVYAFEQWVSYLSRWNLVRIDGDSVQITTLGQEFLKHIIDMNYSFERRG